jgi:hypothetical protein
MKGTEKSQIYETLLDLIEGHLSAHKMAQWQDDKVIEKLSEMLLRRILKRFNVNFKSSGVANPYGDDDFAVPVE